MVAINVMAMAATVHPKVPGTAQSEVTRFVTDSKPSPAQSTALRAGVVAGEA